MPAIRVRRRIRATPAEVWAVLADVPTHTRWMADAERIVLTSDIQHGVGMTFDCHTKVGPFRTVDRMEVTEWAPRQAMGVRHRGLFTGTGRFSLAPGRRRGTVLTWREAIRFPWWLGGPVGATAATAVLWPIWRANVRRLATLAEAAHLSDPPR